MTGVLTTTQKQLTIRLHAHGFSLVEIARQIGCTPRMVGFMARERRVLSGVKDPWTPRAGRLSIDEREQILIGLRAQKSFRSIAAMLGRSPSTVSREVNANGGREDYRAWGGHVRAREQARRPKAFKLTAGPLLAEVTSRLQQWWSPQEIAGRLQVDFPDGERMRVSHETIYQSLFVQGRGELRRELVRCLRSGRTRRKTRGRLEGRGRIPGMVMISERPPEVEDRAVPGHWEGDLILGAGSRSAVGTLVERSTRYAKLLPLGADESAITVEARMRGAITALPAHLARSITWDQGAEMAAHAKFTLATEIPVYFCDPHSPWQRGSNETPPQAGGTPSNGLLRQYLPKGIDLSYITREELLAIQDSLNGRRRKTLQFMTPSEKLAELLR